ncbi:helix-turn-helix domain-containing protein [Mucilaginibacter endophyticus]|uniref:helix-turn-helix domain-containing protein n=1 Tax=Mucilaginibacter endophyticus TaxID=2675003 RepID=UPI00137980FB|nr:AraC family transcriptional regulator [Mucilaginibacter endophyticus]
MSTCAAVAHRGGEDLVPEHALAYRISGVSRTVIGDKAHVSGPGTIALARKNTLLKTIKYPERGDIPFRSIAILLNQAILKKISVEENIIADTAYTGEPALDLSQNLFLKGYFESLVPFFQTGRTLTPSLAELKTREAVALLLQHDAKLKNMLFDFSEPGKIDLEAFMQKNYVYHISLAQFARLSGRSMTTFKRDFKKIFDSTPEQWIRNKRLERAHFLIAERKQAPVSIFSEVGFETLSHFSSAFKKLYGYNPSALT